MDNYSEVFELGEKKYIICQVKELEKNIDLKENPIQERKKDDKKPIFTIKQFAAKHSFLTESSIRWLLYKNPEGFEECVLRNGRRIYIDESKFFKFLEKK
jgi:hypothetical protein